MDRADNQIPPIVVGDDETVQSLVSWQLDRFHHLQNLAQGLLSILVAAFAIVLTAYSVLRSELPNFEYDEEALAELGSQFPVSEVVISSTLGLNLFLIAALAVGTFATLSVYLSRIYFVLSLEPSAVDLSSQIKLINEESDSRELEFRSNSGVANQANILGVLSINSDLYRPSVSHRRLSDYFSESARDLQTVVVQAKYAINAAALRLILLFASGVLAVQIYSMMASGEIYQLVSMNVFFIFFPLITTMLNHTSFFDGAIFANNSISDRGFLRNFDDSSYNANFSFGERLCYGSVAPICALNLLIWILAIVF